MQNVNGVVFMTAEELDRQAEREEQELRRQVKVTGKAIVLRPGRRSYRIELHRCDTAEKIVEWVHHLNQTDWTTPAMVNRFIELACKHHGRKLHNGV
jgi:hypothetical protein